MNQIKNIDIALLATGDEVVSGDILNKNAFNIAKILDNNRFQVKTHLAVRDSKISVVNAIKWLMKSHRVIITTGGLGPTLDDLTIDAIAEATQLPVVFNENAWEIVQSIYLKYGISCPENNKRLARFLEGAALFPPVNGTAHGSIVDTGDNMIIALPGPPKECLPMVERDVIPLLKTNEFDQGLHRTTFYLFAASESHVASIIEPICLKQNLVFGFRTSFPYLEVKVFTKDPNPELSDIHNAVKPWYIGSKPIRYETIFVNHYLKTFNTFKFIINNEMKDMIDWLPGWEEQHGKNEISIVYSKQAKTIQSKFKNHNASFTLDKNYSDERIKYLIKAWLCMQWSHWLNLPLE
ncbi:MAG: competence/damage-inducible protein A [Pseudomonadota bacterium]|nr:competence/damage-inducible protein A [Pseudomonadota bacterium]